MQVLTNKWRANRVGTWIAWKKCASWFASWPLSGTFTTSQKLRLATSQNACASLADTETNTIADALYLPPEFLMNPLSRSHDVGPLR
jgi:hypothetical protein